MPIKEKQFPEKPRNVGKKKEKEKNLTNQEVLVESLDSVKNTAEAKKQEIEIQANKDLELENSAGVLTAEAEIEADSINKEREAVVEEGSASINQAIEKINKTTGFSSEDDGVDLHNQILATRDKTLAEIKLAVAAENMETETKEFALESQVQSEKPNISQDVLPSKFETLSLGQQKFVKEGITQLYLEEARTKAREQFSEATNRNNQETTWGGRLWKNVTKGFQVAKLEKENIQKTGLSPEAEQAYVERLIDIAKGMGKEIKDEDGKLVVDFNTFEGLSENTAKSFENFNKTANSFSTLPQEWAFDSAKSGDRSKFEEAKRDYEELKLDILNKIIAEKGEEAALQGINNIDTQVALRQFITNHPEVQEEFDRIKNDSPYGRLFGSIIAERGAMTGAGFMARSGVKAASYFGVVGASVSIVALPAIAAALGAWRGRARADKKIKEGDIEARHQEKGVGSLKNLGKGLESNISQSEDLAEKLNYLVNRFEEEMINGKNPDKIQELRASLTARVNFSQDKLEDGLVSFGSGPERSAKYLTFVQALEKAKVYDYYSENSQKIDERIASLMNRLAGEISNKRRAYKNKQMIYGALMGAAAFGAGAALREGLHELTEESGLSSLAAIKPANISSVNPVNQETIPVVKVVSGEEVVAGDSQSEEVAQNVVRRPRVIPKIEISHQEKIELPETFDEEGNKILADGRLITKEAISGDVEEVELPETGSVEAIPDSATEVKLATGVSGFDNPTEMSLSESGDVEAIPDRPIIENQEINIPSNGGEITAINESQNLSDIKAETVVSDIPKTVDLPESGSIDAISDNPEVAVSSNLQTEIILPENGSLEVIDEPKPSSEVLEATGNQSVQLPESGSISTVENVVEGGENIQRVVEISNFNDYAKNVTADNIKEQVADGLFANSKEFATAESFMKKFQELNKDVELSDAHKKAAQRIWEEWQTVKDGSSVYQRIIKQKLGLLEKQILYNAPPKGK